MEASGQLHAPAALLRERAPLYPLDRRLDGTQSRSGRGCEEKKNPIIAPAGNSTSVVHPVASSQYMYRKQKIKAFFLQSCVRTCRLPRMSVHTQCANVCLCLLFHFTDYLKDGSGIWHVMSPLKPFGNFGFVRTDPLWIPPILKFADYLQAGSA
jgi:hypothetical protein